MHGAKLSFESDCPVLCSYFFIPRMLREGTASRLPASVQSSATTAPSPLSAASA